MIRLSLPAATAMLFLSVTACTTRGDVRRARLDLQDARRDVRDADRYGDRSDQRQARDERGDARRDLRRTRRAYEDDHRCGPRYDRPC